MLYKFNLGTGIYINYKSFLFCYFWGGTNIQFIIYFQSFFHFFPSTYCPSTTLINYNSHLLFPVPKHIQNPHDWSPLQFMSTWALHDAQQSHCIPESINSRNLLCSLSSNLHYPVYSLPLADDFASSYFHLENRSSKNKNSSSSNNKIYPSTPTSP